jgi:hypothetical protein
LFNGFVFRFGNRRRRGGQIEQFAQKIRLGEKIRRKQNAKDD